MFFCLVKNFVQYYWGLKTLSNFDENREHCGQKNIVLSCLSANIGTSRCVFAAYRARRNNNVNVISPTIVEILHVIPYYTF